eukprot:jgi/Mesvir1/9565/Mv12745-RA.1
MAGLAPCSPANRLYISNPTIGTRIVSIVEQRSHRKERLLHHNFRGLQSQTVYNVPFRIGGHVLQASKTTPRLNTTSAVRKNEQSGGSSSTIKVYHLSEWKQPFIHFGGPGKEWTKLPGETMSPILNLLPCSSLADPRRWWEFELPVLQSLEFVIHDHNGGWVKAQGNANFRLPWPIPVSSRGSPARGLVACKEGRLVDVQSDAPILVVSDLDGTMVGDDAATQAFNRYWETRQLPAGSKLAYSSGRSIENFLNLLKEKVGILAAPDVFIGAVGTQIYLRQKDGTLVQDREWDARLNEHWDVSVVAKIMRSVGEGEGDAVQWLGDGDQSAFKCSFLLRDHRVAAVMERVRSELASKGLQATIVSSGEGPWRYFDVVSLAGGKKNAMEYVRSKCGVDKARTVACGDSGNDILMLEGGAEDCLGLVVGNAQEQLDRWYHQQPDSIKGKRLIKTRAAMAHGILEGLATFGLH